MERHLMMGSIRALADWGYLFALPPAAALLLAYLLARSMVQVAVGIPFLLYLLISLAAIAARLIRTAVSRRLVSSLALMGLLLLLLQGTLAWCRFESGRVAVGVGEASARFVADVRGPLARNLSDAISVTAGSEAGFECRINNQRASFRVGQSRRLGALVLRLVRVLPAPRIQIGDGRGRTVYQGLYKLDAGPGFFWMGTLPHRLRLDFEHESPSSGRLDLPGRLAATIHRGKLDLFHGPVEKGSALPVDGFTFTYQDGSSWCEFEARTPVPPYGFVPGGLLLIASAILAVRGRRSRCC